MMDKMCKGTDLALPGDLQHALLEKQRITKESKSSPILKRNMEIEFVGY